MKPIKQIPQEPSLSTHGGWAGVTPQLAAIRAKDIMTVSVACVSPSTTVRQIALLISEKHVSALPVIDDGKIVGIVSEGDLVQRAELGTAASLADHRMCEASAEYAKAHDMHANDVMTRKVITVSEDSPLAEIAELMQLEEIKRAPVMRDSELVDIVSRSDIVQALARRPQSAPEPTDADDDIIRFKVTETRMGIRGASPWPTIVTVSHGFVELGGAIEDESALALSRAAIKRIPQVIDVKDHRSIPQPY